MRTHTVGSALVAGPSWGREVFVGRYSVAKFPRETREEDTQSERKELEHGALKRRRMVRIRSVTFST